MQIIKNRIYTWAVVLPVLCLSTSTHAGDVRWRSGKVTLEDKQGDTLRSALAELRSDTATQKHIVVRFNAPISRADQTIYRNAGVNVLSYLGDGAYFANVTTARLDADRLIADGRLIDAVTIQRDWKLHPMLAADAVPEWSVISKDGSIDQPADERTKNLTVAMLVRFFDNVSLRDVGEQTVARHGGVVLDRVETVQTLLVEMPLQRVKQLAGEDVIQYIEPPLPHFDELNDSNRSLTGVDTLQEQPYGLDGAGVTVLIYDSGRAFADHVDFGGRLTGRDDDAIRSHSTHVAGTVGGDGTGSGGLWRGMAPGVTMESYGFEFDGEDIFLYSNPGDLENDYDDAMNLYGAVLSNNSIGTNVRLNGFPCEITGDYGITSELIDSVVTGALGPRMRIVWANGNERGAFGCTSTSPGGYHSTPPPACAKNHITVGALDSDTDLPADFTSWGPADDGRLKPDVSGPGCEIGNDEGVTSCDSDGGYDAKCGTSMAAPTVTGIIALMLEDFRRLHPDEPDPLNATIKAILTHTAEDIMTDGPDYQSGYGSVRAVAAVDQLRSGNFLEDSVDQGSSFNAVVIVPEGADAMKVTLAWDDVPGTPNVDPALVNDLDLVVLDPSGTQQFPWTLDPDQPGNAAVRTEADHINNIEQVFVQNPQAGSWQIEVRGFNVPFGPQAFGLVASPLLVNCSSAGIAVLDASAYPCESTALLRVVDCDLNTSDDTIESVTVRVSSTNNPTGFDVVLTETIPESAAFQATLPLGDAPVGGLSVQHGDVVTLTYIDADDGAGGTQIVVTDTADIDCVGPMISDIQAAEVNPRDALITFVTDEPANATIRYGLSCNALTESVTRGGLRTDHMLRITGLQDNTTYHYTIDATDLPGNMTTTGEGACLSFTTPEIPDYFTERFDDDDNDLGFILMIFEPNDPVDFYSACSTPILQLPVDPVDATELTLGDDDYVALPLADGATVSLYGQSYDTIYVGSNGYVTFGEGDDDRTENASDHFSLPRISGLFDDLAPQNGGTISWQQLSDRVVVTFDEVDEFSFGDDDTVTFQIEMFFDGTIRIAYLDVQISDGLAGLSAGNGLDADFLPSDLTAYGGCGPLPPVAFPTSAETALNQAITIVLEGADVGSDTGELTYTIVSLPDQSLIDPANQHVIRDGDLPYALPAGIQQVEYVPVGGFTGFDAFGFVVNDGDDPPDGGDSNVAEVTVRVGGPQAVHSFDLSTDPGWARSGQWEYGVPRGLGSHSGDPTSGYTGKNVFGYNLLGDYPNNMSSTLYLTTDPMDLRGVFDVQLTYQRWLGVERAQWDHAYVEISTDGSSWTTVWENPVPTSISDSDWFEHVIDVSNIADDQPTVSLRWGMGRTDTSVTYPGWNIDDIALIGLRPTATSDIDGDGAVTTADFERFLGCHTGPDADAIADGCTLVDYDADGDVDRRDFAMFQLLYFGK